MVFVGFEGTDGAMSSVVPASSGPVARRCVTEAAVLRSLLCVLQGLDGDLLKYSRELGAFVVEPCVSLHSSWRPLIRQIAAVGLIVRRLQECIRSACG